MEKLVKLLNEKNEQDSYRVDTDSISGKEYINRGDGRQCFIDEHIISKKFGFIEWLVENDKIDFKKVIKNNYWNMSCISNWIYDYDTISNELKTKYLLMILSIQDSQIEFLISILK